MRPVLRVLLPVLLGGCVALAGCSGGDEAGNGQQGGTTDGTVGGTTGGTAGGTTGGTATGGGGGDGPGANGSDPGMPSGNATFTLRAATSGATVIEGGAAVPVALTLTREAGFDGAVTLSAETALAADARDLSWSFDNVRLENGQSTSELRISLAVGAQPLLAQQRTLLVSATDGASAPVVSELVLQIEPTSAPDVYLLIGQSNMVGFSEPDARMAGPGEPDAPDPRIRQLNPTGNDASNFPDAAAFTGPDIVANPPFSPALDPLHDGYDVSDGGKDSGFIGLGLSFAKAALADTTADILLVPAAWSDTGFCGRATNVVPGLGWLARTRPEPAFAGTLLHDRAIARTDLALELSSGVLRGILWHQGEADEGDPLCAAAYAQNLADLIASLRSNIAVDARGAAARGPAAEIPFIVGTASTGADERGSQLPFSDDKLLVDAALRTVGEANALAGAVINDDLVPPAYPCGESSCVHFGAAALREMGTRYYGVLRGLLDIR